MEQDGDDKPMDSTKAMRGMVEAMKTGETEDSEEKKVEDRDDRDPDQEEVYDYFLDAHKDEN